MHKHKYTWQPDLPDQRDFLYRAPAFQPLPHVVDLRPQCSPVKDQAQLGSCTANALAGAMEFIHHDKTPLSRLFIYYNERNIEGTVNTDSGAMLRDGVKSLAKFGVCPESEEPYDISVFTGKPSPQNYTDALPLKISSYMRLSMLQDMQECLAEGFPFVFGMTVYESFESDSVARTGVVNMPSRQERVLGGHAVECVGYDTSTGRFLVRNSWGTSWGMAGYFTIPFAYLKNRALTDDFWTIRK